MAPFTGSMLDTAPGVIGVITFTDSESFAVATPQGPVADTINI